MSKDYQFYMSQCTKDCLKTVRELYEDTGIDLENICYYKDDTHYFVMTAKKSSLLARNVLYQDHTDTHVLLEPDNIDRSQLLRYAKDAAKWTTGKSPEALRLRSSHVLALSDPRPGAEFCYESLRRT